MALFDDTIGEIGDALRAGTSVRVTGPRGSGRSTVLAAVASNLERTGTAALLVRGELVGADQPGYAFERVLADAGAASRAGGGLPGRIDALAASLSPATVLVLDDAHLVDARSLRALATVRDRLGLRAVIGEVAGRPRHRDLPPVWPERLVALGPLRIAETAALARGVLGGGLDSTAVTRVYAKSGGSPLLAVAIVSAARDRGLLVERDGRWAQSGPSLWTPDLAAVVDGLLDEADPRVRELVRTVAEHGPLPLAAADASFGRDVLDLAAQAGLARRGDGPDGPTVVAWPPLVADRFAHAPRPLAADAGAESVASLGRAFADEAQARAERALARWSEERTPAAASACFAAAAGDASLRASVERVLRDTPWRRSDARAEDFGFVFHLAQWTAFEERDLAGARAVLDRFAEANAPWAATCRAAADLIGILAGGGVPADVGAHARISPDPTGLGRATAVFGLIARGRLAEAEQLAAAADDAPTPAGSRIAAWARLLLPLLEGRVPESLDACERALDEARARLDRSTHSMASYTKVMAGHCTGDVPALSETLESALLAGRPELTFTPVYAAFLNIQGMAAFVAGRDDARDDFLAEAAGLSPAPGPFLGMGVDAHRVAVEHLHQPDAFDEEAARAVRARLEAGYLVGAVQTAYSSLAMSFGPLTARELLAALDECPLPLFAPAGEFVRLLLDGDPDAVHAWLARERVAPRAPEAMLRALITAASRHAERVGAFDRADGFERCAVAPDPMHALLAEATAPAPAAAAAAALSAREREIALLAGTLGNAGIAERLGISASTVANHIANALRKTSTRSRHELSALAARHPGPF